MYNYIQIRWPRQRLSNFDTNTTIYRKRKRKHATVTVIIYYSGLNGEPIHAQKNGRDNSKKAMIKQTPQVCTATVHFPPMGRGRWLAWQAVVWGDTMKTAEVGTEKQTPQKTLVHSIQLKIFSCSQYSHVDHRPPWLIIIIYILS